MPLRMREALRVNLLQTRWGWVGLVASPQGVCGIELPVAARRETQARLKRRFPQSREVCARLFPQLQEQLKQYFAGVPISFDVSLDLGALTPFQHQVLHLAVRIPYGEVRSYGWIAAHTGSPGAARAVGGAMAKNPMPVVIPCHRVVRSDGRLGGFSASEGVALKKKLLTLEGIGVGEGHVRAKTEGNARPGQH